MSTVFARGNLLLALGSVVLTLLLLEGAARLLRASAPAPEGAGTSQSAYAEHDPLLGWRKRPGAHLTFRRSEYAVPLAVNSLGLRDPERGYVAPAGTSTLLALGDSFLEGYTVPLEQTLTQVLERRLAARADCRWRVINGGTSAYSTDQEYLFYRSEGLRYRPQVVVLFFYYNDVFANDQQAYVGAPKPVFVFRDGELRLYRQPVPRPRPQPDGQAEPAAATSSALLEWVRQRLWFGAPRAYNALGRLGLWPPNRRIGARMELRVYERRALPAIEGGWEKTAAILERLAAEVAAAGSRLLVVYVPTHMEVSEAAWRRSQERYGMDAAGWDRGRVLRRLGGIAREVGFPLLDLTPALRASEGLFTGSYYVRDGHWNSRGHRVAATELEAFLTAEGWLGGCAG